LFEGNDTMVNLGLNVVMMKLRLILADDNPSVLAKLKSLLGSEYDVLATAPDGKAALEHIRRYQPDVVILDLEMPEMNGLEVTRELSNHLPSPAVLICSVQDDRDIVDAALAAGAAGYITKRKMATELIPAVESIGRGQSFVCV
jgi:two-component system, NarL family, response regulator DegU